jgi:methylmalonyl-CoA mutase
MHYEHLKHSGELPIVGVNTFLNPSGDFEASLPTQLVRASYDDKRLQIENLRAFQEKHQKEAAEALENLKQVAQSRGNIFAALMKAARVCSLGQMSKALYSIGGEYRRSV